MTLGVRRMERRVGGKRGGGVEMLEKEEEEGRKDRARAGPKLFQTGPLLIHLMNVTCS